MPDSEPEYQPTVEDIRAAVSEVVASTIATHRNPRLDPYDGSPLSDVNTFVRDFEDLADSYGWNDQDKLKRAPLYLTAAAKDWYHVNVKGTTITWSSFVEKLKEYFLPTRFDTYLREELRNRFQKPGEPVANYILAKLTLCQKLDSGMTDEKKIEHLYPGLNDSLRMALYPFNPKTVKEFLEQAKRIEVGMTRSPQCSTGDSRNSHDLAEMVRKAVADAMLRNRTRADRGVFAVNDRRQRPPICWNCNVPGHIANDCPTKLRTHNAPDRPPVRRQLFPDDNQVPRRNQNNQSNATYPWYNAPYQQEYNRPGPSHYYPPRQYTDYPFNPRSEAGPRHYQQYPQRPSESLPVPVEPKTTAARQQNTTHTTQTQDYRNTSSLSEEENSESGRLIITNGHVNSEPIKCLIDPGSTVSLIDTKFIPYLSNIELYVGPRIKSVSGHYVEITGKCAAQVKVSCMDKYVWTTLLITEGLDYDCLLGNNFNKAANLIINCRTLEVIVPEGRVNETTRGDDIQVSPRFTSEDGLVFSPWR